jgi:DNA repair exonuclease SbcCD ATPase subunit
VRDIQFKTFSIQNFLSIGTDPVEINFTPGLHLITGVNKDKDGRRNGVGKSTVMDSIHWVLFGTPLRDINKATIANFNTKGACKGNIEFTVTLNGKTSNYKIERTLTPSRCILHIDGEDKTLSTVAETGKLIEKILGFNSTLFTNSVILSINNSKAFLAQDKTTKRKFIEGIFNLEVFGTILADVRNRSTEAKKQIEISQAKVDAKKQNMNLYSGQRDVFEKQKAERLIEQTEVLAKYTEQLKQTQEKLIDTSAITEKQSELRTKKRTISEQIDKISVGVNDLQDQIRKNETRVVTTQKESEAYVKEVKNKADTDILKIEHERTNYLNKLKNEIQVKISQIDREKSDFLKDFKNGIDTEVALAKKELADYIKSTQATVCPTCNRPLKEKIEPDQTKIDGINERINRLNSLVPDQNRINGFNERIELVKNIQPDVNVLSGFDSQIAKLRSQGPDQAKLDEFVGTITALKKTNDELVVKIEEQKQYIKKLQSEGIAKIDEALEKLQGAITKNDQVKVEVEFCNRQLAQAEKLIKETKESKNTFVEMLEVATKEHETLETELKNYQRLYKIFESAKYIVSEEGVKTFIVKKLLSVLNDRIDYYLRKLDSNSTCVFNEFFEETIKNDKGVECSYFNFSGAEMKTIDLACLFAFMDLRRMQGDVAINISMYDELFDSSFDEKGLEHVTDILKERVTVNNEAVFVISHRKESLKAATGEVITLEKQNGITRRV